MSDALSICWGEFSRFQAFANRRKLDRKSWGIDEALQHLLFKIENCSLDELSEWLDRLAINRGNRLGRVVERNEALRAWLKNLATNRSKKYRSNVPLVAEIADGYVEPLSAAIETAEIVDLVRLNATATEWTVLRRIACGESYGDLARELGMVENSLKSLVLRCRRRLASRLENAV